MNLPVDYMNPVVLRCSHFDGYAIKERSSYAERTVYDYELEYYLESDGGIVVDGTYIRFSPGDMNIRIPGQKVRGVPPYACYILCVDLIGNAIRTGEYGFGTPEEAQPLYRNSLLDTLPGKLALGRGDVVESLLRSILADRERAGDLVQFRQRAQVCYLFQEIFQRAAAKGAAGHTAGIQRAVQAIQEGYAEGLTVEALVRQSGLSRAHFHARFLEETGLSPGRMITQCRIERAKNLLGMTDAPVAEIGLQCGYDDNVYFSRIFKKYTGVAPGEFRRRIGQTP